MRSALVSIVGLLLLGASSAAHGALKTKPGAVFPDLTFDEAAEPGNYAALGMAKTGGKFRLSEIQGTVLVLHLFNHNCPHCERQAPFLESFSRSVGRSDLAGKVRLLAVGVGSSPRDLRDFREVLKLTYPMAPDVIFELYDALGDPGSTPLTFFLTRQKAGWVLVDYHFGMQGDSELLAQARVLAEGKAGDVKVVAGPTTLPNRPAAPPMSDQNQLARAKRFLSKVAGKPVTAEAVTAKGQRVFRAVGPDKKPLGLYARVASREPVCDLCHTIVFLFAFDDAGVVRGFEPIHVTKYGNEVWSSDDTAKLEGRLKGRKIQGLSFDSSVDAVSSATISSQLIFDEARRAAALLEALRKR